MDLNNLGDDEFAKLQAEIAAETRRRDDARRAAAADARREKNKLLFAHKDLLLSLMKHARSLCSDDNLVNRFFTQDGHPRCYKCALMSLSEHDLGDVEINVDVTVLETCE